MSFLSLTFASPLILLGLLALPLIWWLLRLTPPRPREEVFPPTRILEELGKREETPAQSPWWLTLLRLLMAAFVIFALSEPIWNAQDKGTASNGPLLLIVDDGWSTGNDWDERQTSALQIVREAENAGRPVALAFTSQGGQADLNAKRASEAEAALTAAEPKPVRVELTPLTERLQEGTGTDFSTSIWMASGIAASGSTELASALATLGAEETIYYAPSRNNTLALTTVANEPDAMKVTLERADTSVASSGQITAFDVQGRSLSSGPYNFENDSQTSEVRFSLPVELRNEVVRVGIDNSTSAGGVQLLDERFRRRRVGLIAGGNADQQQPLLSSLYYISRALAPFSEVRQAQDPNVVVSVPQLIEERVSTLVLADIGTLPDDVRKQMEGWVEGGGMLVRFAGPRLAGAENDTLVPVKLRRGGRSLGGTLTWGTPQPLASFEESSPFSGIPVPADVAVSRQVLAEPDIDLADKTWASLADGTPLVTAARRGQGWIVLFHVTADAVWSNLPLSGSFVDMLRRIVAVSNGSVAADRARNNATGERAEVSGAQDTVLPPLRTLDGFGRLGPPDNDTRPLKVSGQELPSSSIENPPGLYGTNDAFVALNLFSQAANLQVFDTSLLPENTVQRIYTAAKPVTLKPWLLGAALLMLALDCLAVLWMAGALRRAARPVAAAGVLALAFAVTVPDTARAQDKAIDIENTLRTRIAYVKTGIRDLDEVSRKGLTGLTQFIGSRTSLEPGTPIGVDIASDELAFYPLLYWPLSDQSPVPDAAAMARVDAFMKKGGSVLFDTRDQLSGGFGSSRVSGATQRLRQILSSLDIPPLEPVPNNHVLTRAFYLLDVFPGRFLDGRLWVETSVTDESDASRPARQGDGVSSILITSNDLAGAWAVEASGAPTLPIVPPNPRQRVYAYRAGVNIIMYTLTGNYKSDQVHVPALLERLGQ